MAAKTAKFLETFGSIKSKHDEIFKILDEAVRNEEQGNNIGSLNMYKRGIAIIDEALAIPVCIPEEYSSIKSEWNEACKMIHRLKKARAETLQRINFLSKEANNFMDTDQNHQENSENKQQLEGLPEDGRPRTYSELAQALREMQCNECSLNSLELLFTCDKVKLYHIKQGGVVLNLMEDSTLRVIRMEKDEARNVGVTFFIQIIKSSAAVPICNLSSPSQETVPFSNESSNNNAAISSGNEISLDNFNAQDFSSWIYPLVPGVSPCFRTEYGAFIFPDLESPESGSSFGVIVPKDEENYDEILLEILEAILHGVVIQTKEEEKRKPTAISEEVSENIVRGANFVSRNLVKGAEKTGQFISNTTPYLISKIRGAPSDAPPVSQNVQKTVSVARTATGAAACATGYIANKIGSATMSLGRFLAPHIQKHGSTLLSKGFGINEQDANNKMNGVLTIAAGAVEGFGTIYSGLEESAKILATNLGQNSVKIIEHKYGSSAGNLAAGTFDTVGNVINLSQNVNYFTPKGLAKKTAKNAGKAIVQSYMPQSIASTSNENLRRTSPSTLYPNLTLLENKIEKS